MSYGRSCLVLYSLWDMHRASKRTNMKSDAHMNTKCFLLMEQKKAKRGRRAYSLVTHSQYALASDHTNHTYQHVIVCLGSDATTLARGSACGR